MTLRKDNWKDEIYSRVRKEKELVKAPREFNQWLNERLYYVKDSGKPLISDRNKMIFNEYYVEGKTLQQIGNELGTTRENIRQARERTIKCLIRADKMLSPIDWKYKTENVFDLPMSARAATCLYSNNITTMEQLDQKLSNGSILKIKGVGKTTVKELMQIMTEWKIAQEAR